MKKLSLFLVALTFILFSCKPVDEDPTIPTVVTKSIENVADITADVLAEVTDDGGADILERGVCLNTEGNPQVTDICLKDIEGGFGSFTIKVSDLELQTTYYVRAYAVNSAGTAYSNELSFTTDGPQIPTVVTMSIENVADITADVLAEVTDDGGADIVERGVCLNTEGNPQVTDICVKDIEGGIGSFTIKVSDLEPQTTYYVRTYAVNSVGTAYGDELSFTTLELDGTHNGYQYVDLGLSVKWAVCNVGAETPEEYGDFFAWGEIATKETYTENNCSTNQMDLEDISGNPLYDAARANWGGNWRMPTYEELNELYTNCTWTWAYGGYNVTGPNGNSIFMPASGAVYQNKIGGVGELCIYWSSTPYSDEEVKYAAYILVYSYIEEGVDGMYRFLGLTLRPVID